MPMLELIGLVAAFLTTGAFLPQALLVIRRRDTSSISLVMYSMFVSGLFLWLTYGIMIRSMPMILANVITIGFSSIILVYKILDTLRSRTNAGTRDTQLKS